MHTKVVLLPVWLVRYMNYYLNESHQSDSLVPRPRVKFKKSGLVFTVFACTATSMFESLGARLYK